MNATAFVPAHQATDVAWVDAKHGGNFPLSLFASQLNDLLHLLICKFAQVMAVTARPSAAPLLHHVLRVLFREAKKKMLRVDASRVVAPVTHIHPCRNMGNVMFKGINVCADCLSLEPKCAVPSLAKGCSSPVPAVARLVDVAEEPLLCCHARGCHVTPLE
jgi:hypothetical protein